MIAYEKPSVPIGAEGFSGEICEKIFDGVILFLTAVQWKE